MASRAELLEIGLTACGEGQSATGDTLSVRERYAIADALYPPTDRKKVAKPKPGTPRGYPLPNQKRRSFRV